MNYKLHNVSTENSVVSVTQTSQPPNKVSDQLARMLFDAVKAGIPYSVIKPRIIQEHKKMVDDNVRGASSVSITFTELKEIAYQDVNHIFLGYKINGAFVTYTEYLPPHE